MCIRDRIVPAHRNMAFRPERGLRNSNDPVSYTRLDVYKRRPVSGGHRWRLDGGFSPIWRAGLNAGVRDGPLGYPVRICNDTQGTGDDMAIEPHAYHKP